MKTKWIQYSQTLSALPLLLVANLFPQAAIAESSVQERCFGYRVFDINDRTVNLRQSPNGAIAKTVPNGTRVDDSLEFDAPSPGSAWQPILFQGRTLYVSTKLLYRAVYVVFDPNDQKVNIRRQPNGAVIKALPNNTEVSFVTPAKGNWTKVRLSSGEEGYVSSKLLKKPSCF